MALSLSSVSAALERIAHARNVAFGSYVIRPNGRVQKALLAAARRGAHVTVTLPRRPYKNDDGAVLNARAAWALRRAGAHVTLLEDDTKRFHIKAAVCDGVAYLDDRNWTERGQEILLTDDTPRDVALVRAAITRYTTGSDRTLTTRKETVLAREAAMIRKADRVPVIVETENVSASPLTDALRDHARRARTTLVLGSWRNHPPGEYELIASLRKDGIDVRESGTNQKLVLAGDQACIGSANATGVFGATADQIEWGTVTHVPRIVNAVAAALKRDVRDATRIR